MSEDEELLSAVKVVLISKANKDKQIEELEEQIEKMKSDIKKVADEQVYVSRTTLNILLNQWEE